MKYLPWKQQLLDGAELLDAYRVFPRIFVGLYIVGLARVLNWAIGLQDISIQQAGFISVVSGTFPFVLNFYMQTGRQWQQEKQNEDVRYVALSDSFVGQDSEVRYAGDSSGGALRGSVPLRSKVQRGQDRTGRIAQEDQQPSPEE